jgi:FixJ family two-component response regulator
LEILEACVTKKPLISIVDDDSSVREGTVDLIRAIGFAAEAFEGASDFLSSGRIESTSYLIADVRMHRFQRESTLLTPGLREGHQAL